MKKLLISLLVFLAGCSDVGIKHNFDSLVPDYGVFKQSEYESLDIADGSNVNVTVRLDGLTVRQSLLTLSDITGQAIVWGEDLDDKTCSGYFANVPLSSVLDSLSRRVGAEISEIGGVYYLGVLRPDDLATAVVAIPPGGVEMVEEGLAKLLSGRGKITVLGSSVMIRDTVEALRKIIDALEHHKISSLRRYVCELFFIRCRQADLLNIGAKLEIQNIDLMTLDNTRELFKLLLTADVTHEGVEIVQRPLLQVSEGLKGVLKSGREIPLAQKAVSDSGTVETTGYEIIQDGLQITVRVHRVSADMLSVALDIEVSTFDNVTSDQRPIKSAKTLSSNIIIRDGEICLVGGIGRASNGRSSNLFTVRSEQSKETVLIWFRVRELESGKII